MNEIHSVAVVGSGTMGLGIAQVCASNGFDTILYDVRSDQVDRALRIIEANLSLSVEKGKMNHDARAAALKKIRLATQLSQVQADLVIEAAVERLDVKKELFMDLERINEGKAILATNTSSLSITTIAAVLQDPSACVGLHFFNPAERMKLVEIVSGPRTRPDYIEMLVHFAAAIGKTTVRAKDSPGFIVNRVARHYYVESLKLLEGKTADMEAIDALLRSAGFKMGPFELMDLIGIDTNLAVTTSIYEGFGRAHRFEPSRIQQQLVDSGHFGRKTGRGFYTYAK